MQLLAPVSLVPLSAASVKSVPYGYGLDWRVNPLWILKSVQSYGISLGGSFIFISYSMALLGLAHSRFKINGHMNMRVKLS